MSGYLDEVFGPNGLLAHRFKGYTPREGQVALARAVDRAISEGEHLVAEAPTGTGKSVAYAVPSAYHAVQQGIRVVIVTANIALQEQLVRKDLPLLREILGPVLPRDFTYALLKGRNNYLCLNRLENGYDEVPRSDDLIKIQDIVKWSSETKNGDKSELAFEPESRVWSRFSVTSEDCSGKDCDYFEQCWAEAANEKAAAADIVVTNYHLFFADMQVRDMTGDMAFILPRYDVAILDEGHKAVDIARDFFGGQVTEGAVKRSVSMVDAITRVGMDETISDFFEQLGNYRRSPVYKARLRQPNVVNWEPLHQVLRDACSHYEFVVKELDRKLEDLDLSERRPIRQRMRKILQRWRRADEIDAQLLEAMTLPPPKRPEDMRVHFIEEDGDRIKLCVSPVHVAEKLQESLFSQTLSVTTTSATLAVRGSFDFITNELGVNLGDQKARTLEAPSPFRWGEQALLVTPHGLPDPSKDRAKHETLVTETCARVIEEAKGRTLALFTSRRAIDLAYRRVIHSGYRILRQGEMPRTKLIDEFRRDVSSVLLGTESFWAGVDVPGESLSCVFIDRLPFIPPDDPILDALQAQNRDCFMKYSVPKAIIAFKQGFGRLIRAATDRGVVVCMDGRLTTKNYGRMFLDSLPPVTRSSDIADVGRFLRGEQIHGLASTSIAGGGASFVNW